MFTFLFFFFGILFLLIANCSFDLNIFKWLTTLQTVELIELHDSLIFYSMITLFIVFWIFLSLIRNFFETKSNISHKYLSNNTLTGSVWTMFPAVILMLIGFFLISWLLSSDDFNDDEPSLNLSEEDAWFKAEEYHRKLIEDTLKNSSSSAEFDLDNILCLDNSDGSIPVNLNESTDTVVLPSISSAIDQDPLIKALEYQYENNNPRVNLYNDRWLNTEGHLNKSLRLELTTRYENTNDNSFVVQVDTTYKTKFKDERLLFKRNYESYNTNKKLIVSKKLIDLIRKE